jgi:penicillin amidase
LRLKHYILAAIAVVVLLPLGIVHGVLRDSLPPLDGAVVSAGVGAPVKIERDHLGVVTLEAANRTDLAYASGFVHGQDRFFQMDLARRLAAGELSELFGKVALEQDRQARLFRFRKVARAVIQQATDEQRAVVEAYAKGVNAGLHSLHSRPWEYWLLGSPPLAWKPEDTVLVVYSMWWDLQANGFKRELLRREINAHIGGKECDAGWKCSLRFFYPARTEWDAPDGVVPDSSSAVASDIVPPAAGIPGPDVLNVRGAAAGPTPAAPDGSKPARGASASQANATSARTGGPTPAAVPAPDSGLWARTVWALIGPAAGDSLHDVGSNSWAVAGRLTGTGAALVANDMHLSQRVPAVWYHVRLRIIGSATQEALDMTGVTLPGAPLLVAGSNGHIAWGFTNSYGDWMNVDLVPCTSVGASNLQTPSGSMPLTVEREEIQVKGQAPVVDEVRLSPAGKILIKAEPERQMCWFGSWLATLPAATNLNLMGMERASTIEDALNLAPAVGIPHQNLVVGDRDGHIAWTIFGRIPTNIGAERANGHSPWTTPESHPRIVDPQAGRLWTANARVTDDERQEAAIGGDLASMGSEYDLGARARQIRDDLMALQGSVTPAEMLKIQLDDRAVFLTRWKDFLLELTDAAALKDHSGRAAFRKELDSWDGRADVGSVSYRLVRAYHYHLQQEVWRMIMRALQIPPEDSKLLPPQFEQPLWQLVHEQPMHMLAAEYPSWRDFLLATLDDTITDLDKACGDRLGQCTWGEHNSIRIQHPLARALPILAPLLDMPTVELPGDHDMPRVQEGAFGASERFAVSPGHEDQAYFHMPGGQSGHPLSPYYRAGFMAWARGEPLPFLPGPAEHTLTLRPDVSSGAH